MNQVNEYRAHEKTFTNDFESSNILMFQTFFIQKAAATTDVATDDVNDDRGDDGKEKGLEN